MDILDRAKAFIVLYVSTMFITANGQAHAIAIRGDNEKERVLPALCFSKDKEPGHLSALKRNEGPMCVKPSILFKKLRKQAGKKTRQRHTKDRGVEYVNARH